MINVKTLVFHSGELDIDVEAIHEVLGFPGTELPDPFDSYLREAMDYAAGLAEIQVCYRITGPVVLDPEQGTVTAAGVTFHAGKTLCRELRGVEKLLFFVCTAGKSISERSSELLKGEDPAKGYIFDQVGTFLTEAACRKMQQIVEEEIAMAGDKITNRYSPGYCQWDVSDQHKLFSLFPSAPCGVTLTGSALMNPVKSASGLIGIGRKVKFRDFPCELCSSVNCIYRKVPV